jgi:hypothetical protein
MLLLDINLFKFLSNIQLKHIIILLIIDMVNEL